MILQRNLIPLTVTFSSYWKKTDPNSWGNMASFLVYVDQTNYFWNNVAFVYDFFFVSACCNTNVERFEEMPRGVNSLRCSKQTNKYQPLVAQVSMSQNSHRKICLFFFPEFIFMLLGWQLPDALNIHRKPLLTSVPRAAGMKHGWNKKKGKKWATFKRKKEGINCYKKKNGGGKKM